MKLGTISSEGKADVYSYAEDDMVEDPYLKQHLAHFGINMEGMKKVCTNCIQKIYQVHISIYHLFTFHRLINQWPN